MLCAVPGRVVCLLSIIIVYSQSVSQSECTAGPGCRDVNPDPTCVSTDVSWGWPGLASIHREEGGGREVILIIMSTCGTCRITNQKHSGLVCYNYLQLDCCLSENIAPFFPLQLWISCANRQSDLYVDIYKYI